MNFSFLFPATVATAAQTVEVNTPMVFRTVAVSSIYLVLAITGLAVQLFLLIRPQLRPSALRDRAPLPSSPLLSSEGLWLCAVLLGLYGALFVAIPAWAVHGDSPTTVNRWLLVAQSLIFQCATLGFVALVLRKTGRSWREAFGVRLTRIGRNSGLALLFYLSALPHVLIYGLLAQGILRMAGFEGEIQPVIQILSSEHPAWLRVYLVALGVGVAPLAEEVLFRGIGLPLLMKRIGTAPAILVLSLIFALLHFNVAAFVPLFVISIGFSLSYLLTGDLTVPVLMHAFFNTVSFSLMKFLGEGL